MSQSVAVPDTATLPLDWIRSQFPALAQTVNGSPIAFLDGPGGTQIPQRVMDAMERYLTHSNANAHGPNMTTLTFAISRAIGRELRPEDRGGLLRIGLVHYNTLTEINRLLAALTDMDCPR